ncbi:MAG: HAMP domain-containing sensor histidine kinase [Natrialbaceae archaeon]|nr:HAMP domain-containing sensor histidine kinase [Natrialbaceae archaeon]
MSPDRIRSAITKTPFRLALTYLLVGLLWIAVSDGLVLILIDDTETLVLAQSLKGWGFVLGSGLLVYGLSYYGRAHLESTNRQLDRAVRQTSIFHRILRHNLRNQTNIIHGHASLLEEQVDEEGLNSLSIIKDETERLSVMSQKAGMIADVVDDPDEPAPLDVPAIVESTVTTVATHESVETDAIETNAPADLRALADPRLEIAVQELLQNAIEHADLDAGPIHVAVDDQDEDEVVISVSDAGPGIPDIERQAITDDIETPLTHSEGLGLWLAKIIATESTGEFVVDQNDRGGTTAEIHLPQPATPTTDVDSLGTLVSTSWVVR